MFVVDSSAIVAILLSEPEAVAFSEALKGEVCVISALSVFETETVLRGRINQAAADDVRVLLELRRVRIHPFDDDQARRASVAYARFGKGVHPARLNLSDCAAYALAKSLDAPLLYKGDDFAQTDIAPAVTPG